MKIRGQNGQIPRAELLFYTVVWCHGVFYSLYRIYRAAKGFYPVLTESDFEPGWAILGDLKKDASDFEWTSCSNMFYTLAPYYVIHVASTNVLKRKYPETVPFLGLTLSSICILRIIGLPGFLLLLCFTSLMFVIRFLSAGRFLCWTSCLVFLFILNYSSDFIKAFIVPDDDYWLSVTIAWTSARCLSFGLIRRDAGRPAPRWRDFAFYQFYCFYLPTFFTGPLVIYDDFQRDVHNPPSPWTVERIAHIALQLARYLFWFAFVEGALHFLYVSALHFHPHLVVDLPTWELCGLGFSVSQLFMVKYVVLYGLPGLMAEAEGLAAPPKPKCIARIHLYSDMWRHFDRGLYEFLKRFIYVPMVSNDSKIPKGSASVWRQLATGATCFAFVFLWHGASESVFWWTSLNFVGICAEKFAGSLASYTDISLDRALWIRASAVFAAPLLAMSAISNFFFLCGMHVGIIFVRRILFECSFWTILTILFYMYCFCHVSIALKNKEKLKSS